MIRMIKGTYGLVRNGEVIPMTAGGDPFAIDHDKEIELIEAGYAEAVEDPGEKNKDQVTEQNAESVETEEASKNEASEEDPEEEKQDIKKDV